LSSAYYSGKILFAKKKEKMMLLGSGIYKLEVYLPWQDVKYAIKVYKRGIV